MTQQGQHVVVQFAGNVTIGAANAVPRNVLAITGGAGQAEIVVAPGTTVRDWRLGNLVVIDVADRDAAGGNPATPPTGRRPAATGQTRSRAVATSGRRRFAASRTARRRQTPEPLPIATKAEATNPPARSRPRRPRRRRRNHQTAPPAPASVATAQPTPAAAAADTATQPTASAETAIVVPGDTQLGVAAFRRGNTALIVFDQPRSIDLSSLRDDPVFGTRRRAERCKRRP